MVHVRDRQARWRPLWAATNNAREFGVLNTSAPQLGGRGLEFSGMADVKRAMIINPGIVNPGAALSGRAARGD